MNKKLPKKQKFKNSFAEGKDVAQKALEDRAKQALEWLKDKENQEKVLQWGFMIAQIVIAKKPPKKQ